MNKTNKAFKGVWVCGACGKQADERMDFKDASCYLNAVECDPSSLELDKRGLVTHANAIKRKKES